MSCCGLHGHRLQLSQRRNPLPTLLQATEYGLVVSEPMRVAFAKNSTRATPSSGSLAVAATVIAAGAVYVDPFAGCVTDTLGAGGVDAADTETFEYVTVARVVRRPLATAIPTYTLCAKAIVSVPTTVHV